MIIVIPLDEDKVKVCPSFGRAPFMMVFDTETHESKALENPAANAEGGAGIKAAQFVLDCKCDVLVTPRLGQNSADVFGEAGIKIMKTASDDALENLKLLKEDKLEELTKFHAGFHGIR